MSGNGATSAQLPGGVSEAQLRALAAAAASQVQPSVEHARWILALAESGRRPEALRELEAVAPRAGGRAEAHEHLAFVAFNLGAHELACDLYARVTQARPRDPTAWYNLAASERTLGRLQAAEEACNRALALEPGMGAAALLRANARTQRAAANHVAQLRGWIASARDARAASSLSYALGKELDDLGAYDEAFRYFSEGARLRRQALDYDVARDIWKLERIRETFSAERLALAAPLQPPVHGFILGMPRSGTTLIERVLTGNPDVAANGETDNLLKALADGSRTDIQDVFLRFAEADPARVQQAYARRAADPRGRRLVLEKLPLNYLYMGAIRLTLPNARILLVQRAPADNCFAMFSTLFGSAYPFSYSLDELGRYFVAYRECMRHWMQCMPEQVLEVHYERFIDAPSAEGARVAAHFGAAWAESMVRIEDNRTASATASASQIRRPIYKSAAGRWRNYEKHLGPLVSVLEAAGLDPGGG